jgi:hypothetical protein
LFSHSHDSINRIATTTNAAGSTGTARNPANTVKNGIPTPTSQSNSQGSGGDSGGGIGLSAGAVAGITIAGLVVAIISAYFGWKQYQLAKKTHHQQGFVQRFV